MNGFSRRIAWTLPAILLVPAAAWAQNEEARVVETSVTVLDEIMAIPGRQVPHWLLADAEAVAIVPNVVKVGLVAGVRHGRGVMLVRDETGAWGPPRFVSLTGGSLGWQIGVQSTDVVLVFKNRRSVDGLMRGKFTLGVDAAVAAGPVGRKAAAATDTELKSEIYSYSRSRGLFAGVALDGSSLQVDEGAAAVYYQAFAGASSDQAAALPPSATRLMERLAAYTAGRGVATQPSAAPGGPNVAWGPAAPAASTRQRLADSAVGLYARLDDQWKQYLALPGEVFAGNKDAAVETLRWSLDHFDTVSRDGRYRALTSIPEFQTTHALLRQYVAEASARTAALPNLPPPPSGTPGVQVNPADPPRR